MLGRKRIYGGRLPVAKRSKSISAKVTRLQRQVAVLRPELKWVTSGSSITNVDDGAGGIAYLSGISQGTDIVNRVGDYVHAKKIDINVKVVSGIESAASHVTYRVLLVLDKDSNGTVPTIAAVANAILTGTQPINQLNRTTAGRFKILRDKILSSTALITGANEFLWKWEVDLNHKMTFRGTAGSQAEAGKNSLYLVCLSDGTADTVDFASSQQIGFTDV